MSFRIFVRCSLLLFALAENPAALSQPLAGLSGRILDPQGRPIAAASVALHARAGGNQRHTTTDAEGRYRLQQLLPGDYLIDAQSGSLVLAAPQSLRLEPGTDRVLDLTLELVALRQEVVVTAGGYAQSDDETGKSVSVVRGEEIDLRADFSIPEALRTVPGLRIQRLGGPGAFTVIKTRGLRNEDTAVLIDGNRFRDAAAPQGDASGFLEDLMVTNLDRVEVLRGAGSSLHGSHALGGVVQIVTDEGGGRGRGSVLLEGGGLGHFRARGRASGGLMQDRAGYSLGVGHLNVVNGVDGDDAARNTSGQGSFRLRLTPTSTLAFRGYAADSFLQLNTGPEPAVSLPGAGVIRGFPLPLPELRRYERGTPLSQLRVGSATFIPSANNPDARRTARFFSGAVQYDRILSETASLSLGYHGLTTDRSFHDGPGGVGFQPNGVTRSDFDGGIQTLRAGAQWRPHRSQTLDFGYEFESERYREGSFPVDPAENSSVRVTQRSHALFVQEQLRLLDDRFQFTAAFRTQFFSLGQPRFFPASGAPFQGLRFEAPPDAYTGDGSLAYTLAGGTRLRAHVGSGYRAPSLFERFGSFFGSFGYSIFGDPRLRPDRSLAFDGGVDQTFGLNRVRLSATWYYTRLQEVIVFDFSGLIDPSQDPFGRFGGYLNLPGGLARGLELSAGVSATDALTFQSSYTYTNADQRRPVTPGVVRTLSVPEHQFSLGAVGRFNRRLVATADLLANSSHLAPIFDPSTFSSRAFRFDGYVLVNLGLSYTVPWQDLRSVQFFGRIENLFDRTYFENGFRTPGTTARGGLQIAF